jgi:hypothetical protein
MYENQSISIHNIKGGQENQSISGQHGVLILFSLTCETYHDNLALSPSPLPCQYFVCLQMMSLSHERKPELIENRPNVSGTIPDQRS